MPKSLMIRPAAQRTAGHIEFNPIPINQYKRSLREEAGRYSAPSPAAETSRTDARR